MAEDDFRAGPTPDRAANERFWAVPGTRRFDEIEKQKAQQGLVDNTVDGFKSTAAYGAGRVIAQETPALIEETGLAPLLKYDVLGIIAKPLKAAMSAAALVGMRSGEADYDREENYDTLTKDIPYEYHADIMENDNMAAALRSRSRVLDDMERGRRLTAQQDGGLAVMAGSLLDVDLPLSLFSGGAYKVAVVAGKTFRAGKALGLSNRLATGVSNLVQGLNAGTQAGLVVAGVDAMSRETTAMQDMIEMTFMSAIMGTAVSGVIGGDVRGSLIAAQKEFHNRVATDDPSLREPLDLNALHSPRDNLITYEEALAAEKADAAFEGSSVGAVQTGPALARPSDAITDPAGPLSEGNSGIIDAAMYWRKDSGWSNRKDADADKFWTKFALHPGANLTTSSVHTMYKSNAASLNFASAKLFESPSGLSRDGSTSATLADNYTRLIQTHLMDVPNEHLTYGRDTGQTYRGSGYGLSAVGLKKFNREAMLELNDRKLGRVDTERPKSIRSAADQYEAAGGQAIAIGKGKNGEQAMMGFEDIKPQRGYSPQQWSGRNILEAERTGQTTRKDIVEALATGYKTAGIPAYKDARAVANAVVARAVANDADIDTSMISLLTGDGQEFLRNSLRDTGVSDAAAEGIMRRLVGGLEDRGKESFAKRRTDVDWNTRVKTSDGSDLRIVDLLNNDLHAVWQSYTRRVSGAAGLARMGITSRARRREFISASQAEQRALGETPIETDKWEALFSHYNGGAVKGYSRGTTNEGIGVELALVKKFTNLALLPKMGLTQLGETNAIISQNGLVNWASRGPMAMFNKELKAGNRAILDDMAHFTGQIGYDYKHFAPWMDMDDALPQDTGWFLRGAQKFANNAQWLQSYTSLFNHISGHQQQTAVLGIADKVFRVLRDTDAVTGISHNLSARFQSDLGLDTETLSRLRRLVEDGTIEFGKLGRSNYVDMLNMDKWPHDLAVTFASSVTRNMNQVVQRSMAGEQDPWMSTVWGTLITHLKTFPLAAVQKQLVRNMKHMDGQAVSTVLYGMATAYIAVKLKDAVSGTERSEFDTAKQAFSYAGVTGVIPMVYDPVMTMLGLEDMRFNNYGPQSDITPPVFTVANKARRIPGAIYDVATGNATGADWSAIKMIPFVNNYLTAGMFPQSTPQK